MPSDPRQDAIEALAEALRELPDVSTAYLRVGTRWLEAGSDLLDHLDAHPAAKAALAAWLGDRTTYFEGWRAGHASAVAESARPYGAGQAKSADTTGLRAEIIEGLAWQAVTEIERHRPGDEFLREFAREMRRALAATPPARSDEGLVRLYMSPEDIDAALGRLRGPVTGDEATVMAAASAAADALRGFRIVLAAHDVKVEPE